MEVAGATRIAVIAAARSYDEQPVLLRTVKPGAHVISVGSTLPEQREVDVDNSHRRGTHRRRRPRRSAARD